MTYSSSTFLISCGRGSLSRVRSARSSSSSRMMSLQSSTHSSQTNTDGPAISLRTSCWLLPQNEQYRSLPSSCLPRESSDMHYPRKLKARRRQYLQRVTKSRHRRDTIASGLYSTRRHQAAKTLLPAQPPRPKLHRSVGKTLEKP